MLYLLGIDSLARGIDGCEERSEGLRHNSERLAKAENEDLGAKVSSEWNQKTWKQRDHQRKAAARTGRTEWA